MAYSQRVEGLTGEAKLIIAGIIFVVILIIIAIMNPLVIIGAGKKGVVMNWGAVSGNVLNEGIHWRVPIYQSVKIMNVQTVKMEVKAAAYSKDIQTVDSVVALNYKLQGDKVNNIYQPIGDNFEDTLISPAIQESIKAVMAKYTAQELIEKRALVSEEIKTILADRIQNRGFIIDAFSILNFDFSDAYEASIEKKQVEAQNFLTQENITRQVEEKAKQRVFEAEAEAKAIKIQAEAVTQQGGSDYVKLKAIEKWNGNVPTTMIPNGSVPFIDLNLTK
jgi:regulator of protease activity HflC (stomatin/prohibitin superfamily)